MTNSFDMVVGQDRAKSLLKLIGQSFSRRQKLPPIGIFGPSGLGKTFLVNAFAHWLGVETIYISGTAIKDALAFRGFFQEAVRNQDKYYLVFVDECHNLPRKIQENLLSVLEEPAILCTVAPREMGNIKCVDGIRFINKGDVMREMLPHNVSFIFASTDPAMMKDTILNRLRRVQLEPYSLAEKTQIVQDYLMSLGSTVEPETCKLLAKRSRNIRHLKSDICDTYADIDNLSGDNDEMKLSLLDDMLGIDEEGATDMDMDYLDYLGSHNIAGIDTLASVLRTDKKDVMLRLEPYLLEKQWIAVTSKGRILTNAGRKKLFGKDYAEL